MTARPGGTSAEALSAETPAIRAARKRRLYGRMARDADATAVGSDDPLLRACWESIARKWRADEGRAEG